MKPLIIIPTYNEIENIGQLTQKITETLNGSAFKNTEILVVDDGSPDGTGGFVETLAKENPKIHVLHRAKKMGLGTAYVDFSHDPKYLPTMMDLLTKNDVAIGSRYVAGGGTVNWGVGRKILSRGGSLYSRMILGAPIRDFTGGFNGWRKEVLENVDLASLKSDGYSFQIELKYRAFLKNFKMVEFPIVFEDRKVGKSKMNRRIVIEALGRVWSFRMNAEKQMQSADRRLADH